jgi:hypothetical protein
MFLTFKTVGLLFFSTSTNKYENWNSKKQEIYLNQIKWANHFIWLINSGILYCVMALAGSSSHWILCTYLGPKANHYTKSIGITLDCPSLKSIVQGTTHWAVLIKLYYKVKLNLNTNGNTFDSHLTPIWNT